MTAPAPQPKKWNWLAIVSCTVAGLFMFWMIGSNAANRAPRQAPAPVRSSMRQIVYQVDGDGMGGLTYKNATGATEQADQPLPWKLAFTAAPGAFVYIAVQAGEYNKAGCTITVDGVALQSAKVEGGYYIATCSGAVP